MPDRAIQSRVVTASAVIREEASRTWETIEVDVTNAEAVDMNLPVGYPFKDGAVFGTAAAAIITQVNQMLVNPVIIKVGETKKVLLMVKGNGVVIDTDALPLKDINGNDLTQAQLAGRYKTAMGTQQRSQGPTSIQTK